MTSPLEMPVNPKREVLACSCDGRTLLVRPSLEDFPYIDALRNRETYAVGFIPKQQYIRHIERRPNRTWHDWKHEFLVMTMDNDDHTGFSYGRFSVSKATASIWQIAIQEDARRWHRALLVTSWIEAEALRRGCKTVKARVAIDLEANLFWTGAGYKILGERKSTHLARRVAKNGRPLHLYVKHLTLPWQDSLDLEVS